ncbi:hypothetical protein J2S00_000229 [Caldalkalibacillus uzonensis]|uniref:Uncharacterized protein n=1 Tax=Caldalkalibacillus uzonensis TaxID=353224 RepID=A0ABU0CNJ2_9BACI|nr:hypothetical protein [Caldalkalibacillus uzonensis]
MYNPTDHEWVLKQYMDDVRYNANHAWKYKHLSKGSQNRFWSLIKIIKRLFKKSP